MGQKGVELDKYRLSQLSNLYLVSKKLQKSEKNACFLCPFSVLYVYMIKKNDLQKRLETAKKRMCLTLLDVLSIILNEKETLCQK